MTKLAESTQFLLCVSQPFFIILTALLGPEAPFDPEAELYGRKFVLLITVHTGNSIIHETLTLRKQKKIPQNLYQRMQQNFITPQRETNFACVFKAEVTEGMK